MDFDFEFETTEELAPLFPASADERSIIVNPMAMPETAGFAADLEHQPYEGGTDPQIGCVSWRTLISSDRTPSRDLVLGVAEFDAFGTLNLHRHKPAEFYFGLSGEGVVEIDGVGHRIAPGIAVFIPGNAEHGVVAGANGLSFVYGFPENAFEDVNYTFSNPIA